jgi:hypothetical protein
MDRRVPMVGDELPVPAVPRRRLEPSINCIQGRPVLISSDMSFSVQKNAACCRNCMHSGRVSSGMRGLQT